jgi:glycosyltransferase involved in cell wall biosynthesis
VSAELPISVVIPAYNREATVPRAIRSVLRQAPRRPAEILVVDDASSDATAEVAGALGARVLRLPVNGGAAAARNAGFRAATRPWIALLDSDDEWLPHCLDVLWSLREDHVLVAGSQISVGDDGWGDRYGGPIGRRTWKLEDPSPLVYPKNFIVNSATLLRRDAVLELGGYDTSLRYSEDLDLLLRLLERGTGVSTSTVVTVYHRHAEQKTKDVGPLLDQQEAIVRAYAGRPWWSEALAEKRRAVRVWDELRMGSAGPPLPARLRSLLWLLARPRRIAGAPRDAARPHARAPAQRARRTGRPRDPGPAEPGRPPPPGSRAPTAQASWRWLRPSRGGPPSCSTSSGARRPRCS